MKMKTGNVPDEYWDNDAIEKPKGEWPKEAQDAYNARTRELEDKLREEDRKEREG